jgi:VWFA-related protein
VQSIADFQFVDVPAVTRTAEVIDKAAPEPDIATNAAPSTLARVFVIVIDEFHLIEQDIVRIKRALTDTVTAFAPDDDVAIVYVSHSNMSVNFTRNKAKLLAAVDKVNGALGFGLDSLAHAPDGAGSAGATDKLYSSTAPSKFRFSYAKMAIETLNNVAKSLAGSAHARRAILYFSGGTTVEPRDIQSPNYNADYADELSRTFVSAARAGVPIYTIDPRGHVTPDDAVRGHQLTSYRLTAEVMKNLTIQRNNLGELAINTGGRAVVGASDMKRMVEEVVRENGSYYLLGYYPEPVVNDGQFHDVDVKVTRPGLIVRARKGYVAPSAGRATEAAASVLNTAMSYGVNVSGLPIRVSAVPVAIAPKGITTALTIDLDYPRPVDGSRKIDDTIELSVVALDPDAKVKMNASRTLKFSGTAPATGPITFLIDEAVELPAQPLTLRVGLASQALGKAGTSQLAIELPKPNESRVQIGGVAIGLDGPTREAAINRSLIAQLIPFQPTTARVFARADTLRVFAKLFWKGKAVPAATVSIGGVTVSLAISPVDFGGRFEGVVKATVPVAKLTPGAHVLTIEAVMVGQRVFRHVPVEVR